MPANSLDVRNLMTGKDGRLYVTGADNTQIFLAEVDSFEAELEFENTDYQPVGSYLSYAVPVSYSVTLSFTEAVIRDDVVLKPVFDALANGEPPTFEFSGKLKTHDGRYNRQVFRDCIPDGSLNIMMLEPGEIVKRKWSFRANATPQLQQFLQI